jgi:hypothetical protein
MRNGLTGKLCAAAMPQNAVQMPLTSAVIDTMQSRCAIFFMG